MTGKTVLKSEGMVTSIEVRKPDDSDQYHFIMEDNTGSITHKLSREEVIELHTVLGLSLINTGWSQPEFDRLQRIIKYLELRDTRLAAQDGPVRDTHEGCEEALRRVYEIATEKDVEVDDRTKRVAKRLFMLFDDNDEAVFSDDPDYWYRLAGIVLEEIDK